MLIDSPQLTVFKKRGGGSVNCDYVRRQNSKERPKWGISKQKLVVFFMLLNRAGVAEILQKIHKSMTDESRGNMSKQLYKAQQIEPRGGELLKLSDSERKSCWRVSPPPSAATSRQAMHHRLSLSHHMRMTWSYFQTLLP